jgi:hypothetical protein
VTDKIPPLPRPFLRAEALAVMNAGWERAGDVFTADQMHAYALAAVIAERERITLDCESLKKQPHGWNSFSYTNAVNDLLSAIRQPGEPKQSA